MFITPSKPDFDLHADAAATAPDGDEKLGVMLLRDGVVASHDMISALALHARRRGRLTDILLARGMVAEQPLYAALSRYWGAKLVDVAAAPADPRLIDQLGALQCLRKGLLPWRRIGGATAIVTAQPEDFTRHKDDLVAIFGPVVMSLAPRPAIEAAILARRRHMLAREAECRVAEAESCRNWGRSGFNAKAALAAFVIIIATLITPIAVFSVLLGWAVITLLLSTALKIAAACAAMRTDACTQKPPVIARLPTVSVMVALYRESDIAPRLVRRLSQLDYPRELLDIVLIVEENDQATRRALASADLPPWMRIIVAPEGRVKTKPRALNFGLDHCHGSIIGVYDAEDAPEADQIRKVVNRFYQRGSHVACLQGVLDFYNPRTNWLSRCFTIEYATWFRVILPGLQRLGLPIPLGGTTLFFRRAALEELGGWDAHNVTEDADLGMRLARHGYCTELIDTTTYEEANCRAVPWVKQRSRWLKGYMMTWATHMRRPRLLWGQLGPWKFGGFQVLILCTLSQFLLVPVLWSFWLVMLGVPHPIADAMPPWAFATIMGLFIATEVVNITLGIIGLRKTAHRLSPLWVPTLHIYFPLGALASYKAAFELVTKPFYWDKTSHGSFDQHG